MRFVACAALLSLVAVGCAVDDPGVPAEPVAQASAPIVGGTDDSTDASTVYLSGPNQVCSGALIHVDKDLGYVLTAATCTGMQKIVYLPPGVTSYTDPLAQTFAVTQDGADPGHNIRVLQFKGATASMAVTPASSGSDSLAQGTMVELSGFGVSAVGAPQSTIRRHVNVPITHLDANTFSYDQSSGGECAGDEGGPAYLAVPSGKIVVGVMSSSDPSCAGTGMSSRVESDYGSFIDGAIGAGLCKSSCFAGANDSCYGPDENCQSDPSCVALSNCLTACASPDSACGVACAAKATLEATSEYNSATDCACQPCLVGCPAMTCPHVPAGGGQPSAASSTGACSFVPFGGAGQFGALAFAAGLATIARRRRHGR